MTTTPQRRAADYDRLVDELACTSEGTVSRESIAKFVAEARESLESTATIPDFLPVLVGRFAREGLTVAAQAAGRMPQPVPELLFVCVRNAGRSQMAAALAHHLPAGRVHVRSAGSQPAGRINPDVVAVLAERGINLTEAYPKPLSNDVVHAADVIVAAGDTCPIFPRQAPPRLGRGRPKRSTDRARTRYPRRPTGLRHSPAPRPQPLTAGDPR